MRRIAVAPDERGWLMIQRADGRAAWRRRTAMTVPIGHGPTPVRMTHAGRCEPDLDHLTPTCNPDREAFLLWP